MPCSCGNTTCLCGIPCYCLEESCKCDACALALHHSCQVCNKPLITDIPTDKGTCSCFMRETEALILENGENSQCRPGNIPMPVGCFAYGKLTVNVVIPVPAPRFPHSIIPQPISFRRPPPPVRTHSRNILPPFASDLDVVTSLPSSEDSSTISTAEVHQLLDKSSEQSSYQASSGICSTGAQNSEKSRKETCPSFVLQSKDEKKPESIMPNTKSEAEGHATLQESSYFYLPSITIGDISYPVELTDPVWRLPNLAFCIGGSSDSSLKISNPFYTTRSVHTSKKRTNFGELCRQQVPNLNSHSSGLSREDGVTILQMNGQPLDLTKTERSNLGISDENVGSNASLATGTGNKFFGFPSTGNSDGSIYTEHWKRSAFNTFPANGILGNHLLHDEELAGISSDSSSSGMQEFSGVQSQPACAASTSVSRENDCLQAHSVTGEKFQNVNFRDPHRIFSTTQSMPGYSGVPHTSKLQWLLNMHNTQRSEENECPQSGNPSFASVNDKRDEGIDSIPLYIDNCTTRKMEILLKSIKQPRASSPLSPNVASPMQNSDANDTFSNSSY